MILAASVVWYALSTYPPFPPMVLTKDVCKVLAKASGSVCTRIVIPDVRCKSGHACK